MRDQLKIVALTLCGLLVAAMLGSFLAIYSGLYDVAATKSGRWSMKEWFFQTWKRESIESRARSVEINSNVLEAQGSWQTGLLRYESRCAHCHGIPGEKPGDFAESLHPKPPWLGGISEKPDDATLKRWFWATKHGIAMSGMPAWGEITSDRVLWAVVAAMQKFPEMSKQEYESWAGRKGNTGMKEQR